MERKYNKAIFDEQLNTSFVVSNPGAFGLTLHLVETSDRSRGGMEAFSLIFKGPREPVLQDNTYDLQQPVLGALRLFLSPFRQTATATFYDVQFTRLPAGAEDEWS